MAVAGAGGDFNHVRWGQFKHRQGGEGQDAWHREILVMMFLLQYLELSSIFLQEVFPRHDKLRRAAIS